MKVDLKMMNIMEKAKENFIYSNDYYEGNLVNGYIEHYGIYFF